LLVGKFPKPSEILKKYLNSLAKTRARGTE
jgi:hypothetical protein